jgi:hypothetical protein
MKAKIIMLETNSKPRIGQICKNNIQMFIWTQSHIDNDVTRGLAEYKMIATFEIYLTSNTEIKEGDFYYSNKQICKAERVESQLPYHECSKIICSTDKSLVKNISRPLGVIQELPQLSFQSIQLLIDYYNKNSKMPDEVEVEIDYQIFDDDIFADQTHKIKLNPQGTVDITILEDRLFSKEEMELSFQAGNEFGLYMDEQDNFEVNHNPFRIWIKNL